MSMKLSSIRRRAKSSVDSSLIILKRIRTLLICSFAAFIIGATIARWPQHTDGFSDGLRHEIIPLVAIVACIKQTGDYNPADFIEKKLLASIYRTISKEERARFRIELILGYDHDDEYWRLDNHHHLSPRNSDGSAILFDDKHEAIPINYVSIRKDLTGDRPNRIPFNEVCQAAFDYGATYIVRVNDDSEFVTTGWIPLATSALQEFSPTNVGVVGPTCHQGNQEIMTHDMVHAASHYSIFDTYYASEFDNYYIDDWITRVYGKDRTQQLTDWEVVHHYEKFGGGVHKERYKPSFGQDKLLDQLVMKGTEKVERKVSEMERSKTNEVLLDRDRINRLRILGTAAIERVDGPMQKVHVSLMRKSKV